MNAFIDAIYLQMMEAELNICFAALHRINTFLALLTSEEKGPAFFAAQRDFFVDIQTLAHHAAAVSRYLWPSANGASKKNKERANARGARLRYLLGVDDSHFLKNKDLRHYFEHFDERIDHWAETSAVKGVISNCIGPKDSYSGPQDTDFFSLYDPSTKEYHFQGNVYNIQSLANALDDVQQRLNEIKLIYPNHFR